MSKLKLVILLTFFTFISMNETFAETTVESFSEKNDDGIVINYTVTSSDKLEVEVTSMPQGYGHYIGDIRIPSTISHNDKSYSVVGIGTRAFEECTELTGIELPSTLIQIESRSFYNCCELESITLNEGLKTIGNYAFQYCNSLKTIDVPNSVTSIAHYAFSFCDNLTEVRFPQNSQFTSIPYCCCYYNSQETLKNPSLKTVILPANITGIEDYAFYGCENLNYIFCDGNAIEQTGKLKNALSGVPTSCVLVVRDPDNFSATDINREIVKGAFLDETTSSLALKDDVYFVNTLGKEVSCNDVTYERTFQAGNFYLPLFLPFSMSVSDLKNSLGDDCIIAQLMSLQSVGDELSINWSSVTSETLDANTPYIVKVTADKGSITATDVVFARDRETRNGTFESGAWKISLHGTLLPETISPNDGKFVLTTYNGGEFRQAGSDLTLKPYRFYMTIDARPASHSPNNIRMNIDGEESQDALESILINEDENGNYFDLQGRKINNPSNGIFINNGKKVAL